MVIWTSSCREGGGHMDEHGPVDTRAAATFNSSLEKCHAPPTPPPPTFRGFGIFSVPTKPSITALNDRPASLEDWEYWWITAPRSSKLPPPLLPLTSGPGGGSRNRLRVIDYIYAKAGGHRLNLSQGSISGC